MQIRIRLATPLLFTLLVLASSRALNHMDQPVALLLMVPGYVVQAWLFAAHRALGGTGYVVTMVGVSALVWTLILLGVWVLAAKLFRPGGERG
jgi:uncharacterized membrane protein